MFIDFNAPIHALSFGKIAQEKGRWHEGRTLTEHLLVYCTENEIEMQIGQERYLARTGDTLLIPAGTFYAPRSLSGCAYWFFHFTATNGTPKNKELLMRSNGDLPTSQYAYAYEPLDNECMEVLPHTPSTGDKRVEELFLRAENTTLHPHPSQKILLDCLLRELLVLLSTDFSREQNHPRRLQNVLRFVQGHFEEELTLSSLAKQFFVSESYLARLFRIELKTTLSHYINALRINVAQNLLVHTDLRVTEIAEKVGYTSTHYFSRIFKTVTGVSPLLFRQQKTSEK